MRNSVTNTDGYCYSYSNSNSRSNSYSYCDSHVHTGCHANCYSYADGYTPTNADTQNWTDTENSSNSAASALIAK